MKQSINKLFILISLCAFTACQRQQVLFYQSSSLDKALPERPAIPTETVAEVMLDSADNALSASEIEFTASTATDLTRLARPAETLSPAASHFTRVQQQSGQVSTRQIQKVSFAKRLVMKYVEVRASKQIASGKSQKFGAFGPVYWDDFRLLYWIASAVILLLGIGTNSPFLMILGFIIGIVAIVASISSGVRFVKSVR